MPRGRFTKTIHQDSGGCLKMAVPVRKNGREVCARFCFCGKTTRKANCFDIR
jgi:hypothetical protein